jgi:CheY-like chemotaxis protein
MSRLQRKEGVILVIDDDPAIREAMRDTLGDHGYEVETFSSAMEGLAYLRGHEPPQLIFVDWNMAPMNAPQFMDALDREPGLADVPVVLLTADMKAEHKLETSHYQGLLTKPVDLDALFEIAERFAPHLD